MLSDADRKRLADIEVGLRSEDPDFVRRFDPPGRFGLRPGWRGIAASVWVVVGLTIIGLGMVIGAIGMALIGLSVVGVGAVWWISDHRPPGSTRRPPHASSA
jgi:Protein of unknown function (DUF3040)